MWSCEPSGGRGGSATRAARRVCEPVRAGGSAGMTTVGVVGLGLLGSAVAARLRAGGHVVVGYDVVAEKVQALVAGGRPAPPTAEAAAGAAGAVGVGLPPPSAGAAGVPRAGGPAAAGPPGRANIQTSTPSPPPTGP